MRLLRAFSKLRAEARLHFRFRANFYQMAGYVIHSNIISAKVNKLIKLIILNLAPAKGNSLYQKYKRYLYLSHHYN